MNRINWKKGGASALISSALFLVILICAMYFVDNNSIFRVGIKAQMITDTAADAAAAAAYHGNSLDPKYNSARSAAEALIMNNESINGERMQVVRWNLNEESLLHDKIIDLKTTYKGQFVFPLTGSLARGYTIKRENKTQLNISRPYDPELYLPEDYKKPAQPPLRHRYDDSHRTLSADEYSQIVFNFQVQNAQRYNSTSRSNQNIYISDVTTALGCPLPIFFSTATGTQITNYNDWNGKKHHNGSYYMGEVGGTGDNMNISNYYKFVRKYVPTAQVPGPNGETDFCANPCKVLKGWKVISQTGSESDIGKRIQAKANNGYPTVIFYTNGDAEIVMPSLNGDTDHVYVNYGSTEPIGSHSITNNTNTTSDEYVKRNVSNFSKGRNYVALYYSYQ